MSEPLQSELSVRRRSALVALVLLVPSASIGVAVALHGGSGILGKAVFVICKVWLFGLPLAWHIAVDREAPRVPPLSRRGMAAGVGSGLLIVVSVLAAYLLFGRDWIDPDFARSKADEVGLASPGAYLAGALYWCTINSLAEEYVWRWFVFTRCERLVSRVPAVVLSGLFFTIHHVIALAAYFDWRVVVLGSLGVFLGGVIWSWIYLVYRNLWAAYVSHVAADIVIFGIGYTLLFP